MQNLCPCCGRRITAKRQFIDKKLEQDLSKANFAMEVLSRIIGNPESETMREACQLEYERLNRAVSGDYRLLWSIYRRKDKANGYAVPMPIAA